MNLILIAALLTGTPEPSVERATVAEALGGLSHDMQTGSLIVSRGDCLAVKIYSVSTYTHVAAVVVHDGNATVYDATGGAGVRKQTLRDYLVSQRGQRIYVFHPHKPLSAVCAARFEQHLESQLGRPYAIHHHVTGRRAAGIHCSEYVTDALIAAEWLTAKEPPRVSPATLVEGILKAEIYELAATFEIVPEPAACPADTGWCGRMWFDTKLCTGACWAKMRGWFCCK